jgi:hypothetical protein
MGDDLAKTTVSILSMIILSASTVFGAKSASSWSISGHGENLLPGKSDKGRRRDLMADVYACGGCSLGGGGYPGVAGRTTGATPAVHEGQPGGGGLDDGCGWLPATAHHARMR